MTSLATPAHADQEWIEPRSMTPPRIASDAPLVGGVASQAALRLGASALIVRIAFGVLTLAAGVGLGLYVAVWALGVGRAGRDRPRTLRHDLGVVALTASILVVVFVLVPSVPPQIIGPLAFVSFALGFTASPSVGADLKSGKAFGRITVGLVMMFAGLIVGAAAIGDLGQIWAIAAAAFAIVLGLAVVLAPWIREVLDGAGADRAQRVRAEERADIAAHLHDSVLQTLTLIQNRAHESEVVAALAHQQERELRRWLYPVSAQLSHGGNDVDSSSASLGTYLEEIAAAVEDDYLIRVDSVLVGDTALTAPTRALAGAVREALINAAKFAETRKVSLFVQVEGQRVLAFVRDRGVGFDPALVPADRKGIADSIEARVERVGGRSVIRSSAGAGTEVRIEVFAHG